MSRSLLVSAIAVAAACGFWGLAARSSTPPPARPAAPVEHIEATPTVAARIVARPSARKSAVARTTPTPHAPLHAAVRITGDGEPANEPGPALTVEEVQAAVRAETEGLVTIRNPDGSETLNHEGRFTDYTILRIGPDGKPRFECVQGELALKRALPQAAADPTKKEGK